MTIQWFPGHMAKARRQVTEQLSLVDIIFELADARLPESSRNPMLDEIIQAKPRLLILTKSDLADPNMTARWIEYYESKGQPAIAVDSFKRQNMKKIVKKAEEILHDSREKMRAKGVKPRAIRAMIVGVPNVGKSTLINQLANRKVARTGGTPGVTKAQQWIRVGREIELLDTPGILWPKFEDQTIGQKLALTGAIKDRLLHLDDIAIFALQFFHTYYPGRMEELYKCPWSENVVEIFDAIGHRRQLKESDGDIDYDAVAHAIVQDVRKGKLGRYTLDRPIDA